MLHVEAAFKARNSSVLRGGSLRGLPIVHIKLLASSRHDNLKQEVLLLSSDY